MKRLVIPAVLVALYSAQMAAASIEWLYGRWEGTWYVDTHHSCSGPPSTYYAEWNISFDLHEWDWLLENYGTVWDTLDYPVKDMSTEGLNVSLEVFIRPEGEPGGHATFTGILNGDKLEGHYDEYEHPNCGWGHFSGPARLYSQTPVVGDANGDRMVTDADYTIWADTYLSTTDLRADWNDDGQVTDADYTMWADNYGYGVPDGPIPEPAALSLLTLGGLALIRRRRA